MKGKNLRVVRGPSQLMYGPLILWTEDDDYDRYSNPDCLK